MTIRLVGSPVGTNWGREALVGQFFPLLVDHHRMVNKSMRCAAQSAQKAATPMSVAACDSALLSTSDGTSSAVTSSHSAASVAAGARGTSPRANDGSPFGAHLLW